MSYMTLAQFRAWLEPLGGSVDDDEMSLSAYSPPGYVWQATDTTSVCHPYANNVGQRFMRDAMLGLVYDASHGLRKCNAEESTGLEYLMDEPWTAADDAPAMIPGPVAR